MVIKKKKNRGKTKCLYRKLVWLGVALGHRDLISVFHSACLFFLYVRIGMQVASGLLHFLYISTKISKCQAGGGDLLGCTVFVNGGRTLLYSETPILTGPCKGTLVFGN